MRRRTPGVLPVEELIAARLKHVAAYDVEALISVLEPMVLDPRRERLLQVIGARLSSVSVLFDSPYDPHNGAAVLRSCEAFGVQTLHVIQRSRTPFLAAASVARGAGKWVDVVTHEAGENAVNVMAEQGIELVAAHPDGELEPEDLAHVPKVGIVLGNERDGIQEAVAKACVRRVRVPMRGFVESLNVSVTLAILLHAATKNRPGDLDEASRRALYARGLYFSVAKADAVLAELLPQLPQQA